MNYREIFWSAYSGDVSNLGKAIWDLKNAGASQMECTKTIVMELKLPLKDADAIVINSAAWNENKETLEKFRDDFGNLLEQR